MKPVDKRIALDQAGGELTGAIRRAPIEPATAVLGTIDRIVAQNYPPHVLEHAVEQLANLSREMNRKIQADAQMIARLQSGLQAFEKRLSEMCREQR